ncbi:MAG: restriction endonuclease subunit M [Eubacteriales bacterium]|nr:restriction endonuclease subunit M [Eubacteriales bacterium]
MTITTAEALVDFDSPFFSEVADVILLDRTTKKNIIWATDQYGEYGEEYSDRYQIRPEHLCGNEIVRPRILKSLEEQQARTRSKAEVFTPAWLCNQMNNYLDDDWFGHSGVFNISGTDTNEWIPTEGKIEFHSTNGWKKYVDSRRLEITCGEAPYLVSRYDASTGEMILPLLRRIGLFDRKMRVVNENAEDKTEWLKWAFRALQSCYGYEYQGDSLIIARMNVLFSFIDYYRSFVQSEPDPETLREAAKIISWNLWQMDGLKGVTPLGVPYEEYHQMTIFELFGETEENKALPCKIFDWRSKESVLYNEIRKDK